MNRRWYLTGIGVGMSVVAGCATVSDFLESEAYEEGDKESMLPDRVGEEWPDQDLEPRHDVNPNFDRVWIPPDESLVVMMAVAIHESVSEAEESFERSFATASDPRSFPLADEAYISDDGEMARCVFRHSNAMGNTLAARFDGITLQPDRQRATDYASRLFQYWG